MHAPPVPANEAQRLQALNRLSILDTPLEERFDCITRMVCLALNVPMSAFSLIDETRQWQKSNQGLPGYVLPRNQSFCAHAILKDEVMLVPDTSHDDRFRSHTMVTHGVKVGFYAGIPIKSLDGFNIGTLCAVDTKPRELTNEQLRVFHDLADMVETEFRVRDLEATNSQLARELEASRRQAMIDPLTHIWNRSGLMEILRKGWAQATRLDEPVVVAMVDLDHFKKVNDEYGHPVGDLVLQSVARRITSVLRVEDTVGRMGGEEFLVVLPRCRGEEMFQVLDRMRKLVEALPVVTEKGDVFFTLSCGAILARPSHGISIEHAIERADEALYAAKQNGRNRIELSTSA